MRFQLGLALAALAAVAVNAGTITIEVKDANNFCTFLPPTSSKNRNIADTEYIADAFCLGSTPNAQAAGPLADGFIQSAHYVATDNYVQVTGQMDPTKMNLNVTDEGGQYDIVMPKGALCAGWAHFVNLIEPLGQTYCVRCCHSKAYCNRGISEKGCAHIIPGDYSGPLDGSGSALPTTAAPAPAPTTTKSNAPASSSAAGVPATSSVAASGAASSGAVSSGAASSGAVSSGAASSAVSSGAASGASNAASESANPSDNITLQSIEEKKSGAAALRPTAIAIGALLVSMRLLA